MKKGIVIAIIVIVIVGLAAWWVYQTNSGYQATTQSPGATSTPAAVGPTFDQNISDGDVALSFPSADFGLATNQQQLSSVHSYIPPCDEGFEYCLYYINTSTYAGTNFETAGLRIEKRPDLDTESLCLNTPPAGFDPSIQPSATSSADTYSTSVFDNVGGAAAGHTAADTLYRVYDKTDGSCYEFDARVGQSEFGNYPSGTIQQFTSADETALQSELGQIVETLTLASSGEPIIFP